MKSILKNEEVLYVRISFKEALVLLPLMNELATTINNVCYMVNVDKKENNKDLINSVIETIHQYKILENLGFASSIEVDPYMDELISFK